MTTRIGVLTAGSDFPGLNAAIRAIGRTARGVFGMEVIGFRDGFRGLVDDQFVTFEGNTLSGNPAGGWDDPRHQPRYSSTDHGRNPMHRPNRRCPRDLQKA